MAGIGRTGGAFVNNSSLLSDRHQHQRIPGAISGAGKKIEHKNLINKSLYSFQPFLFVFFSLTLGHRRSAPFGHGQCVRPLLSDYVGCGAQSDCGWNQDGHRATCEAGVRAGATGTAIVECHSGLYCG